MALAATASAAVAVGTFADSMAVYNAAKEVGTVAGKISGAMTEGWRNRATPPIIKVIIDEWDAVRRLSESLREHPLAQSHADLRSSLQELDIRMGDISAHVDTAIEESKSTNIMVYRWTLWGPAKRAQDVVEDLVKLKVKLTQQSAKVEKMAAGARNAENAAASAASTPSRSSTVSASSGASGSVQTIMNAITGIPLPADQPLPSRLVRDSDTASVFSFVRDSDTASVFSFVEVDKADAPGPGTGAPAGNTQAKPAPTPPTKATAQQGQVNHRPGFPSKAPDNSPETAEAETIALVDLPQRRREDVEPEAGPSQHRTALPVTAESDPLQALTDQEPTTSETEGQEISKTSPEV
ncbi:hypothetical protein EXIGLDRAFT_754252 [Exidia glandulosa HHB12029]|uniref:Uncharacterized protein n=1 Tax=Exidia glandulosa HHB12029 TaxID=1314781 RepID=A0A165D322_EXIGL|nr:hypothetical protein EXIGLDRAFT_754252 [Exidia glandulosa HHB12029]